MLDIALNPGQNQTTLFNLSSANVAFQPTLNAAPNDWPISLGYAQGANPNALAIDAAGDVWTVAYGTGGSPSSIAEMSLAGDLMVQMINQQIGEDRGKAGGEQRLQSVLTSA